MKTLGTTRAALLATVVLGGATAAGAAPPDAAALRRALDQAVSDARVRRSMALFVECRRDGVLETAKASGSGLGIWNGERQFRLDAGRVVALLRALRDADFASLEERYGGAPEPSPATTGVPPGDEAFALVVTCRVELALGGHHKEVVQLARGRQSPVLKALAEELLGICQVPGRSGVAAASLRDGLEKIARGALAPETWSVTLHRRRAPGDGMGRGFLLAIVGSRATTREDDAAGPAESTLELTPAEVRALARQLAAADPGAWPVNLYSREYTDLSLKVLNHEVSVQARQFEGLKPETHAGHQAAFGQAVTVLDRLHDRVRARSRKGAPAARPEPEGAAHRDDAVHPGP